MKISEPMTLFTDYLLAALALLFAVRLVRTGCRLRQTSILLWAAAFFASAAAAAAGGISHGLALYLGEFAHAALWKLTVYAVGIASLFLLSGAIFGSVTGSLRRWLLTVAVLKFLFYAVWMITHNDFIYVIFDYAPALLGVLILQVYGAFCRGDRSAGWLIAGILVSFVAAGIQASGLALHENFNHNDLYHVIQMGAFYLLYRGGRLLRDRLPFLL